MLSDDRPRVRLSLSLLVALGRRSACRASARCAALYVELIRGVPFSVLFMRRSCFAVHAAGWTIDGSLPAVVTSPVFRAAFSPRSCAAVCRRCRAAGGGGRLAGLLLADRAQGRAAQSLRLVVPAIMNTFIARSMTLARPLGSLSISPGPLLRVGTRLAQVLPRRASLAAIYFVSSAMSRYSQLISGT